MKVFSYIFSTVVANVLLIPRNENFFTYNFLNEEFLENHNIKSLVSFKNTDIYTTSKVNYNNFKNIFDILFEAEEDKEISIYDTSPIKSEFVFRKNKNLPNNVPWHLNSITNNKWKKFNKTGSCHKNKNINIHTYILDTGIDIRHPEFEGRAEWLKNFADNVDTDCQNHGTHCAGLVGSKSFGICRDAKLFAIKVLDCRGYGTLSNVIKGIEFAFKRHVLLSEENQDIRSIISMSLGGGFSKAINKAIESCLSLSDSFYFVVASGNENSDACNTSPASAEGVLSVMAMGENNKRAFFSNFGECTDIYSPGVDIESTIPKGGSAKYSGTSMSTPLVAGVLNHYLDMYPHMNMIQIKKRILKDARTNIITENPKNTVNKLVYLKRF